MSEKKYRAFCGILYPDSTSYSFDEVIENLDCVFDKWAYIHHDRDVWTEADEKKNPEHKAGTLKKAHVHWVGYRKNPVMHKTIVHQLGLASHEVEWAKRGWLPICRYLIHLEDCDKASYEADEVTANFCYTTTLGDELTAEDKARGIMAYILETDNVNLLHLGRWSLDSGFWSEFLRAMPYWKLLCEERKYKTNEGKKENDDGI